jgi:phosphoglycolate phosphatase-like HAD superfamily hydrolase
MKLVCFDIDGTLLHTNGAGRRAIQTALVDVLGTSGPIDTFRMDGRTDGEIVLRLAEAAGKACDDALMRRVLDRYVELLGEELAKPGHETGVYPGVRELLDALEVRDDILIGMVTGNVVEGARLKLRSAGLDHERFVVGGYGSDHWVRAELPAVARRRATLHLGRELPGEHVIIIGDTPADMQCGQGIGARGIGVGTASYRPHQLMAAGAYAAFDDLSPTERVIEAIVA